ncbi:MAG: TonB-dependent receptor [Bacteroidetes bacterium]|nr:TonB-dependent receptor [Bacteroidota bacterium]
MRLISCFLLLVISASVFAQDNVTISGKIRDKETGEELIGATVFVEELKTGAVADFDGFYSITLQSGYYTLRFNFIGYEPVLKEVKLLQNEHLNIVLSQSSNQLAAVEVSAFRNDENVKSAEMGVIKLNAAEMKTIPVLFGESDVMKTLTLMPGVATTGDGNTGLYVRGGGPDQNLILMDGAPLYNASHLLGFFSVFNGEALDDVTLYKGGIPANYGGRISSVLDVKLRDGNKEKLTTSGGLGLISSRLTLEGPLVKDKSSFIISGRRTYADQFLRFSKNETINNSILYFYDMNFKMDYKISEKDKIFFSGYHGRDVFDYNEMLSFDWGNTAGTLRWNHIFNDKLLMNTSLIYSKYDYSFNIFIDESEVTLFSGIEDVNLKVDWDWFPNDNNKVKFGISTILHDFSMPSFRSNIEDMESMDVPNKNAIETGIYIQNEQKLTERLSVNYGLRYSIFNLRGPGEVYDYDDEVERVTDTTSYKSDHIYKSYGGLEPRLSLVYLLDEHSSVKMSYNRGLQYLHLLSNTSAGSPSDLWIPVSNVIRPQIGNQFSTGYFRNFLDNMFETSVEVYYKTMDNIVDYKNGANILFNPTIETELLFGRGWAYGTEFFIKKRVGAFTGWVGYTISRSMRQIEGINNDKAYPQRYDRTHDLNILLSYAINPKWTLSGTWIYATGNPVTFPVGQYEYEGRLVSFYTERNAHRLPAYHRMDLSATYNPKKQGKRFHSSWNFSIFNVYARENPFMITFRESEINPGRQEAVRTALFRIVPSVTWNFKF